MNLEKNIQKIKSFIYNRYKNNLAAILIFGSVNTDHFKEGESDIDHMIFVKEQENLNFEDEIKFLLRELGKYGFATQYFHSLESIKKYLKTNNRLGWSTYITIVADDGSRVIYSTPEFEKMKTELMRNKPTKNEVKNYVKEKDDFELHGYFKEIGGYILTKALMAHLRRKLQVLSYFKTGKLIFDYETCLNNVNTNNKDEREFEKIYDQYKKREILSEEKIETYCKLAEKLTKQIDDN